MAQHTRDLGRLELVSTTTGVRLQLVSNAQVFTRGQSSDDRETPVAGDRYDVWTSLAANFHIDIEIELLNLPEHLSASQVGLSEQIAQSLAELPLWQQLQLQVSAKETMPQRSNSAASLRIYINHAADGLESSTRKMHKLAQNLPSHNVEPPNGVRRAELCAVRMRMSFLNTNDCKRRKLSGASHDPSAERDSNDEVLQPSGTNIASGSLLDLLNVTKSRRTRTTPERSAPWLHFDSTTTSLTSNRHLFMSGADRPILSLKRCLSTNDIDADYSVPCQADVMRLFIAGLHHAISTPASLSLKATEVVGSESFRQLADVWPAIFSPGCVRATSSRAMFLPTISHALTDICISQARSMTLRSKFAEINRRHATQRDLDASAETTQDRLSCRLWHLLQHRQSNGNHTQQLNRLKKAGSARIGPEKAERATRLSGSIRNVNDQSYDRRMNGGILFDSDEPTERPDAGSSPEWCQEGHATDTSSGLEARDVACLTMGRSAIDPW